MYVYMIMSIKTSRAVITNIMHFTPWLASAARHLG